MSKLHNLTRLVRVVSSIATPTQTYSHKTYQIDAITPVPIHLRPHPQSKRTLVYLCWAFQLTITESIIRLYDLNRILDNQPNNLLKKKSKVHFFIPKPNIYYY